GFRPKIVHETDSASTSFRLVESGMGISIEPLSSLRGQALNIKYIVLEGIPQKANLTMMWQAEFEEEFPGVFALLQSL
ncbi:MAG: LysR substrate-binding domain-containing protein, partial [Bacteroidota bacterium]